MLESHPDLAIPPDTGFLMQGKQLTGVGASCAWEANRRAKQRREHRILDGPVRDPYETWKQYQMRMWPRAA